MKAVTGNRLSDGAVVYLNDNDQWTTRIADAARFEDEDTAAVLEAALSRTGEIADAYVIEVTENAAPAGREALRETIRTAGPTVRRDLGLQAEA